MLSQTILIQKESTEISVDFHRLTEKKRKKKQILFHLLNLIKFSTSSSTWHSKFFQVIHKHLQTNIICENRRSRLLEENKDIRYNQKQRIKCISKCVKKRKKENDLNENICVFYLKHDINSLPSSWQFCQNICNWNFILVNRQQWRRITS